MQEENEVRKGKDQPDSMKGKKQKKACQEEVCDGE
jgi:hypothetical protein